MRYTFRKNFNWKLLNYLRSGCSLHQRCQRLFRWLIFVKDYTINMLVDLLYALFVGCIVPMHDTFPDNIELFFIALRAGERSVCLAYLHLNNKWIVIKLTFASKKKCRTPVSASKDHTTDTEVKLEPSTLDLVPRRSSCFSVQHSFPLS